MGTKICRLLLRPIQISLRHGGKRPRGSPFSSDGNTSNLSRSLYPKLREGASAIQTTPTALRSPCMGLTDPRRAHPRAGRVHSVRYECTTCTWWWKGYPSDKGCPGVKRYRSGEVPEHLVSYTEETIPIWVLVASRLPFRGRARISAKIHQSVMRSLHRPVPSIDTNVHSGEKRACISQ